MASCQNFVLLLSSVHYFLILIYFLFSGALPSSSWWRGCHFSGLLNINSASLMRYALWWWILQMKWVKNACWMHMKSSFTLQYHYSIRCYMNYSFVLDSSCLERVMTIPCWQCKLDSTHFWLTFWVCCAMYCLINEQNNWRLVNSILFALLKRFLSLTLACFTLLFYLISL